MSGDVISPSEIKYNYHEKSFETNDHPFVKTTKEKIIATLITVSNKIKQNEKKTFWKRWQSFL